MVVFEWDTTLGARGFELVVGLGACFLVGGFGTFRGQVIGGGFLAVGTSELRASYLEMRVAVARVTTGFFDRWGW